MASVNSVTLIGNLGRDPEIRYMPSGDAVTSLNIATTDKWKDKETGEIQEATEWHRVSLFGKLAEIASQYLSKGSQVYIEGSLRTRKYTDKDGIEKYATEIRGNTMKMLGSRQDGGDGQQRQQAPRQSQGNGQQRQQQQAPRQAQRQAPQRSNNSGFDDMDDDIPFRDPMSNRAFALACA